MNLSSVKKIFPIIAAVFIIIVIILLVIPLMNRQDSPDTNQPVVNNTSPTTFRESIENVNKLPKNIKDTRQEIINGFLEDNKGDLLLHQTNDYKIEYIPSLDIFYINISKEPVDIYKQQAQDWFLNYDLEQSDICNFSIRFILAFELKTTNPDFSNLPNGCS